MPNPFMPWPSTSPPCLISHPALPPFLCHLQLWPLDCTLSAFSAWNSPPSPPLGFIFHIWDWIALPTSLVAQTVNNLPAIQENLGQEDPLEKKMATHSSILAWRIPWTEELVGHSPCGHKESDTTEQLTLSLVFLPQQGLSWPSIWSSSLWVMVACTLGLTWFINPYSTGLWVQRGWGPALSLLLLDPGCLAQPRTWR